MLSLKVKPPELPEMLAATSLNVTLLLVEHEDGGSIALEDPFAA